MTETTYTPEIGARITDDMNLATTASELASSAERRGAGLPEAESNTCHQIASNEPARRQNQAIQCVVRSLQTLLSLAVLSLGLAAFFESLFTLEWRYPYCGAPTDGPAVAVFGMPFPYARFSGVSSLTYDFVPQLMALDVSLLAFAIAVPFATVMSRMAEPRSQLARRVALVLGVGSLTARVGWLAFSMSIGTLCPVASLADSPYLSYSELRPFRVATGWHHDCVP